MNKKIFLIITLSLITISAAFSGDHNLYFHKLSLNEPGESSGINNPYKISKKSSKAGINVLWYTAIIINPMLVSEDKKVFFGLTKEISIGKFPYGRLAFEYSYIFREYNKSHLRFSYNYDFILEAGDFVAFLATPGAGYFTDTKNNGWFLQGSAGALIITSDYFGLYPYLRYRHTFIKDKIKSDINDLSLGVGFAFYY